MKRLLLLLVFVLTACTHHSVSVSLSHEHVTHPVTYPQTPPIGGPHNPQWLRCGIYTEPVPNEFAVHSMEHGTVWITYRPDLPEAEVARLRALQSIKPGYFLLSPYAGPPGLPAPIVASTWGTQVSVSQASDERLTKFIRQYAGGNQGGEMGADCLHGLTPAEARALLAKG